MSRQQRSPVPRTQSSPVVAQEPDPTRSPRRSRGGPLASSAPHVLPVRLALAAVYLVAVLTALMLLHFGLTPDVLIFVLLGAAVVVGQTRLFVRDWGVFLVVLILWQQTGGLAQWAGFPLHEAPLIAADRAMAWPLLHGALPQVWLQQHLFHPGFTVRTHYHAGYWSGHVYHRAWWDHVSYPARWQWYDIVSAVVYGLHFPEPLLVGFAIWLYNRSLFHRYAVAFLVLAAMAFVVYIVYPAVPPWMAGSSAAVYRPYHLIPDVVKIFDQFNYFVLQQMFGHGYTQVLHVTYNKTAAMPSLHAAFPVLSALYLRKAFGRWGWVMLGYAGVVFFSVVYMAEHWMIDVVVGLVFAVVAYLAVEWVARYWVRRVPDQASPEDLLVGTATKR